MLRSISRALRGVLCGGLVALGSFASPAMADDAALDKLYGEGVHAYFSGDSLSAQEFLSESIAAGSRDPRAYYFRGLAQLRNGDEAAATKDFKSAAMLESRSPDLAAMTSRSLQRVQGSLRMTIEKHRTDAKLAAFRQQRTRDAARYGTERATTRAELGKQAGGVEAAPKTGAVATPDATTKAAAKEPAAAETPMAAADDLFGDVKPDAEAEAAADPAAESETKTTPEEAPAAEKPAAEKPAVEAPAAEAPAAEAPAAEEPAAEMPADEKPATEEPAMEEPATAEPAAEEPAAEEPAADKSAAAKPAAPAAKPAANKPAAKATAGKSGTGKGLTSALEGIFGRAAKRATGTVSSAIEKAMPAAGPSAPGVAGKPAAVKEAPVAVPEDSKENPFEDDSADGAAVAPMIEPAPATEEMPAADAPAADAPAADAPASEEASAEDLFEK